MAKSNIKVDTKALEQFQRKLERLNAEQLDAWNEATVKELAARLLGKVRTRTPVGEYDNKTGKQGGTLRRGWTVGEVVKTAGGYSVEIINNVEYASYVEYGHRTRNHQGWVNGRFMMTISEKELEAQAPRILENKLKKLFREVF